jgi:hypothetical protein
MANFNSYGEGGYPHGPAEFPDTWVADDLNGYTIDPGLGEHRATGPYDAVNALADRVVADAAPAPRDMTAAVDSFTSPLTLAVIYDGSIAAQGGVTPPNAL